MKRRQRDIFLQPRRHAVVDQDGPVVIRAAMDNAMSGGYGTDPKLIAQPCAGGCHRPWNVRNGFDRIGAVRQRFTLRVTCPQPGPAAYAIHLALDLAPQLSLALDREDLEFHA